MAVKLSKWPLKTEDIKNIDTFSSFGFDCSIFVIYFPCHQFQILLPLKYFASSERFLLTPMSIHVGAISVR